MDKIEFGRGIRQRRISLNLNQADVAEMAGISTKALYLLEQGKGNPSLDTMLKIMYILGLVMKLNIRNVEQ